jgi:hypothetical protein
MKEKENKIYIQYKRENIICSIFSFVLLIFLCVFIIINFNNFEPEDNFTNMFIQNNLIKILIITGTLIFVGIFIIRIIFYSNCDYYLDIKNKKIHLINGTWKFKNEIILEFDQIKNIVLIESAELGEVGKIYTFKIDFYDNELNAYEILKNKNYDIVKNIADKISKIINVEIIDWSHIENYEGYRKRIL